MLSARHSWTLAACLVLASACSGPSEPDGAVDAAIDGGPGDAGVDAGPVSCTTSCASTDWRWDRALTGDGRVTVSSLAMTPSGGVVVTGSFEGTVDLGGGARTSTAPVAAYVAAFGPAGEHAWDQTFSGVASAVSVDDGGDVVVAGWFWDSADFGGGPRAAGGDSDAFVARYSASGEHVWDRVLGAGGVDAARSVATADGVVVVTGRFEESVDFGGDDRTSAGRGDAFVAMYDATGALGWVRTAGGAEDDGGIAVAVDARGGVAWSGAFRGPIDLGGGSRGAVHDVGAFLARLEGDGAHVWDRVYLPLGPVPTFVHVSGVDIDASGGIALTGTPGNLTDFGGGPREGNNAFLAVYASDGAHLWDRVVDSQGSIGRSVALDARGVLIAGVVDGYSELSSAGERRPIGRRDAFVSRYDVWGCPRYHLVLGGASDDDAAVIAANEDQIALGGWFTGEASLGGDVLTGGLAPSGFVVVFAESDACCAPIEAACGESSTCCMDVQCNTGRCRLPGE
ncbi:MAG: hypothetical protein M3Y87_08315 [Myxococcota bacterium]|nr:hypothetical protein [Myxococcota bacterium]